MKLDTLLTACLAASARADLERWTKRDAAANQCSTDGSHRHAALGIDLRQRHSLQVQLRRTLHPRRAQALASRRCTRTLQRPADRHAVDTELLCDLAQSCAHLVPLDHPSDRRLTGRCSAHPNRGHHRPRLSEIVFIAAPSHHQTTSGPARYQRFPRRGHVLRLCVRCTIRDALTGTDHADKIRKIVGQIQRAYELDALATPNVPRFDQFRDEVKALNNWDRVLYQDDGVRDPSAEFTSDEELADEPSSDMTAEVAVLAAGPTSSS